MQDLERKIELLNGTVVIGRHPNGLIGMLQPNPVAVGTQSTWRS
jgi:hypothetical protein